MKREIILRSAQRTDAPDLIRLISALADYEKLAPPDAEAHSRLIEDGFGARPRFEAWLAFVAGMRQPVGYAIIFETYSSFLARPTLYLEDIFVLPDFRQKGVGKALLRKCAQLAYERGCGRMEWTCLDWNTKAQTFYRNIGAIHLKEWFLFRLTRDRMAAFLHST